MNNKAQFYMLDAFFAATILFLGAGLLVSDYIYVPEERPAQRISEDVTTILFNVQIGDIFNNYTQNNYQVLNEELTPIQQAHAFHYNATTYGCIGCLKNSTSLMNSILQNLVPSQYGINITIDNGTHNHILYQRGTLREADFMIVKQQIIISPINSSHLIGPDIAEVRVWR